MIRAERIPDVRAASAAGRMLRRTLWMARLVEAAKSRPVFRVKTSPTGGSLRLIGITGGMLLPMPRATFNALVRHEWITTTIDRKHGRVWQITDAGREAGRAA